MLFLLLLTGCWLLPAFQACEVLRQSPLQSIFTTAVSALVGLQIYNLG